MHPLPHQLQFAAGGRHRQIALQQQPKRARLFLSSASPSHAAFELRALVPTVHVVAVVVVLEAIAVRAGGTHNPI
mgnify:CR=1 FL=1